MSKPLLQFVSESVVGGNDPWTTIKVLKAHNNLLRKKHDVMKSHSKHMLHALQVISLQHGGRLRLKRVEFDELPAKSGLAISPAGEDEVAVEFIPEKKGL